MSIFINERLTKKPKRFSESLVDDITQVVVLQLNIDLQLKGNEIYGNPLRATTTINVSSFI